jgi:anthranilate phosphoribosyltransferase
MSYLAESIKKVATGPHLSKDLSEQESLQTMLEILSGEADPVQAAIFFIAMRMKRETNEENLGIWRALQQVTDDAEAQTDDVLVLADPYNGFNRHHPLMALLPPVLAAAGLPTVSQGVYEMGPKFGVTHAQVLEAAGVNIDLNAQQAAERLGQADIGWAYTDQSVVSPAVFALQDLRTRMIKRPSLATLEKMIMPVRGRQRTHLLIGFVHKAYPEVLSWLAEAQGYASACIVRGLEGGIVPTLREVSNNARRFEGEHLAYSVDPIEFGIEQTTRGSTPENDLPVTAAETVELAIAAMDGKTGVAFDSFVLAGGMVLQHIQPALSAREAADRIRAVLTNGAAKRHFERGR